MPDSGIPRATQVTAGDPHTQAVRNTLRWADEAATQGDIAAGLEWLATVEAIGEELPEGYRAKRVAWSARVRA